MSEFVEPSEKERLAALRGLTDAALVGHYWRLEDLDCLTDDERRRLRKYRHETYGYEVYCESVVAHGDRHGAGPGGADDPACVADLTCVLDRWEAAFLGLKRWQHERSVLDGERNPVEKVLIYEESRLTGMRGRIGPRLAVVEQHPSTTGTRVRPPRARSARGTRARVSERSASERSGSERSASDRDDGSGVAATSRGISRPEAPVDEAGPDAGALKDAVLVLAEAVDRLAEAISRRAGSRTPPEPRSGHEAPERGLPASRTIG